MCGMTGKITMQGKGGLWYSESGAIGNVFLSGERTEHEASYKGSYAVAFGPHQLSGPLISVQADPDNNPKRLVTVIPIEPSLFLDMTMSDNMMDIEGGKFQWGDYSGVIDPNRLCPDVSDETAKFAQLSIPQPAAEPQKVSEDYQSPRVLVCNIM